jgi:uncharacterized membrane protein YedE/YeeE
MTSLAAFLCGLIFGIGLMVSGMAQPAKVLNFLDLFGTWDASLAFVMAAALVVSGAGYALAKRRAQPLIAMQFYWPEKTVIDGKLVLGATLFGIGWGLAGLCPGPALVNLASLSPQVIVFVIAMAAGMVVHDRWSILRAPRPAMARSDG